MEARKAWDGKCLFAVCALLAGWSAGATRADALVVRFAECEMRARESLAAGSDFAEFGADAETGQGKASDALSANHLAGAVCFNPPDVPPDIPPDIPPVVPDNPIPPIAPIIPDAPVIPPEMAPDATITGHPNPEPATLVMGMIGSVCAGAAVWRRRKGAKATKDAGRLI